MKYRTLGKTGLSVSEISFGAWAIGGSWGTVDDATSLAALRRALDVGVNFFDTSDVYGDGRSEKLLGQLAKERPGQFKVATKIGRRSQPHSAESYTPANIERYVDRSLSNLATDCLDLVQIHCPPTPVFYNPEVFDTMERLTSAGKVRFWGASVEKVEEAIKAIEYAPICAIQIVFNIFRQRPAGLFFEQARKHNIGVLARVPLASGLLTGGLTRLALEALPKDDHRTFNRLGEAFDQGETLSGLGGNLDAAFAAIEALRSIVPPAWTMTDLALRWILSFPEVTCAIPGAKRPEQVDQNVLATNLAELSPDLMPKIAQIYGQHVKKIVHHRW